MLHTDLRPKTLDEVLGNRETIKSIKSIIEKEDRPHCYMFHGKSGTGKTSLIRILASMLGASELDIHEYNIADTRGIDDAREIIQQMNYQPFGESSVIILDECFPARTLVHTSDGRKSISSICEEKYNGTVLSYNVKTQQYEYNKVVNWIKKIVNRKLLVFEGSNYILRMTDNHKIYDEYFNLKQAKEFSIGDKMIVADKKITGCGTVPILSKIQKEILFGIMMGDGNITRTKNLARVRLINSEKQKEYLDYKRKIFSNIIDDSISYVEIKSGYCDNKIYSIATRSTEELLDFYNMFYPMGIKKIPNDMSLFSWASLAFLVMDDGSLNTKSGCYTLSTHAFTKEDNIKFIKFLHSKFGIVGKLTHDKRCDKYYINIDKKSSSLIAENINKYMLKSMEYKLPKQCRLDKYIFSVGNVPNYGLLEVKKIYYEEPESPYVYNIEVENNHNYFVNSGFLVGNCHQSTRAFQEALLKPTEDIPKHAYVFIATTEPNKIIPTLRRRFMQFETQPVDSDELFMYLVSIAKKYDVKLTKDVVDSLIEQSYGSVATALVLLEKIMYLNKDEQLSVLDASKNNARSIIDLCQALLYGKSWSSIIPIVSELDENPEGYRRIIMNYMMKVLLNPKSGKNHLQAANIINIFSEFVDTKEQFVLCCYNCTIV